MAALEYRASRLVRTLDPITGKRGGFGEGSEVVSARCGPGLTLYRGSSNMLIRFASEDQWHG